MKSPAALFHSGWSSLPWLPGASPWPWQMGNAYWCHGPCPATATGAVSEWQSSGVSTKPKAHGLWRQLSWGFWILFHCLLQMGSRKQLHKHPAMLTVCTILDDLDGDYDEGSATSPNYVLSKMLRENRTNVTHTIAIRSTLPP